MKRNSIGKKLLSSGMVVLAFILLMIIASQVVGRMFKETSEKLVVEYNELDAIQNLKFSISQLIVPVSSFAIYGNHGDEEHFRTLVHNANEDVELAGSVLTERHDTGLLSKFKSTVKEVDSLGMIIYTLDPAHDSAIIASKISGINALIDAEITKVNGLLSETKSEIREYNEKNKTIIKHSTFTILTLSLVATLLIIFGGWIFIRRVTQPIKELVTITKQISKGEKLMKVEIDSDDEFEILAESFNEMMAALNKTTVSRNYLDNILKNMFDALIITDSDLVIQSANSSATKMLEYSKEELVGMDLNELLGLSKNQIEPGNTATSDVERYMFLINSMEYLITKQDEKVPVLLSCSSFIDKEGNSEGLIIVGHDLTEKKAIENKLEKSRKQTLININEAQEEERIRIATDLHDGLGQMLAALSYSVQELKSNNDQTIKTFEEAVMKIQNQIDLAIKEAKNLAHNLIPIVLKDFGLIVALKNLINSANELYDIDFHFNAFDFNERIDPKREKAIYRICQESMNNIIKHSKANTASYQIFWQDCSVVLVIEDDGVGFNLNEELNLDKRQGIGLISMKERASAFEGNLTINSEEGKGTELIVEIPCQN